MSLKALREAAGLSQSALASASGVSIRMIQHYEQGVKDLSKAQVITALKLAKSLGVTVEQLISPPASDPVHR